MHFTKHTLKTSWDNFEVTKVKTAIQCSTDRALDLISRKPKCQASYGLIAFTDSCLVTEMLVATVSFFKHLLQRIQLHIFSAWNTNIHCDKETLGAIQGKCSFTLMSTISKTVNISPTWTITGHLTKPPRWKKIPKISLKKLLSYSSRLKCGNMRGSQVCAS